MPTDLPRITITLTPDLSHWLSAASKVMKRSKADLVREVLTGVQPALQQLVTAAQAIERATPAQKAQFAKRGPAFMRTLDGVLHSAEGASASALAALDLFAGLSEGPVPPSVNKGGDSNQGSGAGKVVKLRRVRA